jgi:hypothetical protein
MSAWNWIQLAAAVGVALIMAAGRKLPAWLGFIFMGAVSILIIVVGVVGKSYRFAPLGVAALASTGIAWVSGAISQPQGDDDTLGGTSDNIPGWAWIVIAVLMVAGIVIGLVLKN